MANQLHPTPSINLLTQDALSSSLIGKFLLWTLSIGRYVVVFTELIVILSFLSRFKLDRDLTDLNEAIARQKAIVLSYGDLETKIRYDQERLALVRQEETKLKPPQVLTLLNQTVPADIKFDDLSLTENSFKFSAVALTPQGLAVMLNNLVNHPLVEEVNITDVSSQDQNNSINFSIDTK